MAGDRGAHGLGGSGPVPLGVENVQFRDPLAADFVSNARRHFGTWANVTVFDPAEIALIDADLLGKVGLLGASFEADTL
jgi:hypothetical protein